MKQKRSIYIYWALILVPALLIAAAAFNLLRNEQERLSLAAVHTLSQRALSICETIHVTVEVIQDNLEQALFGIEQNDLQMVLVEWEKSNPLVRNVFIYHPEKQLVYPVEGMASTFEEREFIKRYEALFNGRVQFDANQRSVPEVDHQQRVKPPSDSAKSYYAFKDEKKSVQKPVQSSRKKLLALSRIKQEKQSAGPVAESAALPERQYVNKSGWIPWFDENRLHLLGWVKVYKEGAIYGVELELVTLLSRLVVDFPVIQEKGITMVLQDGEGDIVHQAGPPVDLKKEKPSVRVPVSPLLPHWQMVVYVDETGNPGSKAFLYLSLMLLGVFIAAIVIGGVMLTRLTLSNMKDARQKTSFVSSVSHELKTPLTSIRMYAELLLSNRIKSQEKIQTYLGIMVSESQRLTRLINNVLDFGKLEQGKKKYHYTRVDVAQFLNEMIHLHQIRIQEQGLEIKTHMEPGDYVVRSDRDALEQVVLNILDNALKYAGNGKYIKFILEKDQESVLLKICDDGPGVPKSQRDLIFKKFHRVDDSLTANQPGSGLGLNIARQILQDLGGNLTFEPIADAGSCFVIRI